MRVYYLFLLLLLFCIKNTLHGQELLPFVENFTKTEYNGDNQVWSVVQGNDNAIYFANNHYFLRYNGVKWERYSLPHETIIRSVFADGDKIYCGSYKEFGYWQRVEGKMKYFSISGNKIGLFDGDADNEEVWKIFKHKGKLYFQSFNIIFMLDGDRVEKIKFPSQVSYCYTAGDDIFAATVINGVYILKGKDFIPVNNWSQLNNTIIHGINRHSNLFYIFTKNNGVYTGNKQKLQPWNNPLNEHLKNDVVLTVKFIGNKLAIGTALRGLYVVDLTTGKYKNFNRQNAIKNNAVLSITSDNENDLWLGLDNGIAHIEINSPIEIFTDNTGVLGSVYALSAIQQNNYLLASNHGVFSFNSNGLKAISGSQGQVWDLYRHKDVYIIGHNDGTFIYNGTFNKVNPVTGGWEFIRSELNDVYFQAHYAGISCYKNLSKLSEPLTLEGITKPVKQIAQTRAGELWAADLYRGLYRITFSDDLKVYKVENISAANNINNDYGVKLFKFRGQIFFYINDAWYTYNSISQKLDMNVEFNKSFKGISDIIPVNDDSFIVVKDRLLYLIFVANNNFIWKAIPEKYYFGKLIMDNINAYANTGKLLINLDDGFLSFNASGRVIKEQDVLIEAVYKGKALKDFGRIEFNQPLEISLISKYFGYNRPQFFYRLNNSSSIIPAKQGLIQLSNLESGKQLLEVYYNNGLQNVKLTEYNFTVNKPWYLSTAMILLYILITAAIFFVYYRWNKIRYLQKIKLNEEELRHQRKIMELELEAEKKIREQEYEKHTLEVEVQNKASEVAGKSLSIAKHSEMIESIQQVLDSEATGEQLKTRIRKIIKSNSFSKNEWIHFEKNLFKSHEDFVNRLTQKYPSLTSKDIKLSIYLRMNLASKEIAPLMNISFRGVELHRYRLRKKLDVAPEDSLSKFMLNI